MIKKCKQCGCVLTSAESNRICENCRSKKRKLQAATTKDSIKDDNSKRK